MPLRLLCVCVFVSVFVSVCVCVRVSYRTVALLQSVERTVLLLRFQEELRYSPQEIHYADDDIW